MERRWCKTGGFSRTLLKCDIYFLFKLPTLIFLQLDTVSGALQKAALRFDQAEKMVKAIRESVNKFRKQAFPRFWKEAHAEARELG